MEKIELLEKAIEALTARVKTLESDNADKEKRLKEVEDVLA